MLSKKKIINLFTPDSPIFTFNIETEGGRFFFFFLLIQFESMGIMFIIFLNSL